MDADPFETLDEAARTADPPALIDRLIALLEREGSPERRFDALMLGERARLGLPLAGPLDPARLPRETLEQLDRARERICRQVGEELLAAGDVVHAWPLFRALGETEPVAAALERWADATPEERRGRVDEVIEIALREGVHPALGFRLVLEEKGTCAAITALQRDMPFNDDLKRRSIALVVERLHGEIAEAVTREIEAEEGRAPARAPLADLVRGRDWLFARGRSHVDDSHLRAAIRMAPALTEPGPIETAIDLCRYGEALPRSFQQPDPPPFEEFYREHRILLSALAGREIDEAVEHFIAKAEYHRREGGARARAPGEIVVFLLHRVGRAVPALAALNRYLEGPPRSSLAPSLYDLCAAAGDFGPMRAFARRSGDLVLYAAALLGGR